METVFFVVQLIWENNSLELFSKLSSSSFYTIAFSKIYFILCALETKTGKFTAEERRHGMHTSERFYLLSFNWLGFLCLCKLQQNFSIKKRLT